MGPIRSTPSAMAERSSSKSSQTTQAERGTRRTAYDPSSLPRGIARVPSRIRSRSKSLQENLRRTLNTAVGRSPRQTDYPQSAVSAPPLGSSSQPFPSKVERDVSHNSPTKTTKMRPPSTSPLLPHGRILFYHKHEPYYGFTNFSPHAVYYHNKSYPTSEHLFQSLKFAHRPNLAEHIRTCDPRPSKAFSEARRFQPEVRVDWKEVNIKMMDLALYHKFRQHRDLQAELLGTGSAELVENSDKDAFWGVGYDGKGRNELGKALERLRAHFRDRHPT